MLTVRFRIACLFLAAVVAIPTFASAQQAPAGGPVTLAEDEASYTLSNGILTARILKRSGDIRSLQYRGVEVLTDRSGHAGGYWSHDTTGGKEVVARVTINPNENNGERAEVSVKGISGGVKMGHGPGAEADGDIPADIEIRYALGRGEQGIYTYCEFHHLPEYAAATMTEARFGIKLADMFDWMTLGNKHDMHYPAGLNLGDKYVYTCVQHDNPVFGFSSTTANIGFWLINPSVEYLSGGPTKVEFLGHRDTTQVAAPVVLNYWRSSHYGGAAVMVNDGEEWKKVIGPFYLYVNSGATPQAMYQEAVQQHARQVAQWPYQWVEGVDYPRANERATVNGQLVLNDPQATRANFPNLMVGLTHMPWASAGDGQREIAIDWQTDAKFYQFWVRGNENGEFSIPDVRPGTYALRAFADGVLGEFAQMDVTVSNGGVLNLGKLEWTPVRKGKQLWDIGIPNRTALEFLMGEKHVDPAISLTYATLFPDDITYTIGKSDFAKDWFFQHVPHNENPNAAPSPYSGVNSPGRDTPRWIKFDLNQAPRGQATLRLAICGTGARQIGVEVNGQSVGTIAQLRNDGAITRHSIQGLWYEKELSFSADLLKPGENTLTLTIPGGPINNGVIYDYLRLELDESPTTALNR